ncbi:conserved hypothetical protein [Desulfosarcina cetonica]|nr:conserved hypothetical protein [Desulfosarcina cetonica]
MPIPYPEPAMRQKIFSMGLAVETVSLYLLCCALVDAGMPITLDALAEKWNESIGLLDRELKRLVERNIIQKRAGDDPAAVVYQLVDEKNWQ